MSAYVSLNFSLMNLSYVTHYLCPMSLTTINTYFSWGDLTDAPAQTKTLVVYRTLDWLVPGLLEADEIGM